MSSKVQKMILDEDAHGDSLLGTVIKRGEPSSLKVVRKCLEGHLTVEQVRKILR